MARHVPRADVRRLDARTSSPTDALTAFGLVLGARARRWPASPSPTGSGCGSPGTSARVRERFALPAPALRQQVVLRRAHRPRSSCARAAWFGRFGQQTFERVVVNGLARRRHDRDRPRRLGRGARAADRLPARLRRPARARPRRRRPLLPASRRVTLHLSILLWLPLAAVVAGARAARRRGALRGAAGLGGRRSCSPIVLLVRLRRRPARAAVRHRRDVDQRAGHPLQARRRRAEPLPHRARGAALLRQHRCGRRCASGSARACSSSGSASPRAACSAR